MHAMKELYEMDPYKSTDLKKVECTRILIGIHRAVLYENIKKDCS